MEPGSLKPSRSDAEDLTPEEKAIHEQHVKDFLQSTTPVRALKPSRSEASEKFDANDVPADASKAEMERFKQLEADTERINTEGGTVNDDSYVETEYYDDLNSVDKSVHHETGTGFIQTDRKNQVWHLDDDEAQDAFKTSNGTNPATNDWEPTPPVDVPYESKVHRSEP